MIPDCIKGCNLYYSFSFTLWE